MTRTTLHPKTLTALKRLAELVVEGGGQLLVVLIDHPKLKNDLHRPKMEEIGDRITVFEFGGMRDRQRDYIDWALKCSLEEGVEPDEAITDEAATLLAAKLKTPLQIGRHLVRAFEAGFEAGVKPVDDAIVETVLSRRIDDLEPQLTRWLRCQSALRPTRRQARRDPPALARRPQPAAFGRTDECRYDVSAGPRFCSDFASLSPFRGGSECSHLQASIGKLTNIGKDTRL